MVMMNDNNFQSEIDSESIFLIGRVLSVEGRTVKITLNKDKNHSHILYKGKAIKNIAVGGYIKIIKGFISIIGKVEGENILEDKQINKNYTKEEIKIDRVLQVSLFGHFEGAEFKQGIKEMPLIDNECYLLNQEEFNSLHQFYTKKEKTIDIGSLTEESSQRIRLGVNRLFASHIGIFGNTGSGKSNTLTKIYTELFRNYGRKKSFKKESDFVIIDFNGEYIGDKLITKNKQVYKLSSSINNGTNDKYPILKESINKVEVLSVLLEATEKTQKPFLDRTLRNKDLDECQNFDEKVRQYIENLFITVMNKKDKNMREGIILELFKDLKKIIAEESISEMIDIMQDLENNLHCHSQSYDFYWGTNSSDSNSYDSKKPIYESYIKSRVDRLCFEDDEFIRLKLKIILNYFYEIIKGYSNQEHIGPLIGRMFRNFNMLEKLIRIDERVQENNLTVVSLRDVNLTMKKIIPLIVVKELYDEKKKLENNKSSLHIIIDEAHNILSATSQRESDIWKDYRLETFEEIIKEGRKFGVFLTIASQRPYDISPTIISQLHNYFIHRLINNNDINAVEKAVSYLDKLSFQTIPILSVGSCFVAGLASNIPVKVDIEEMEEKMQPQSSTINIEKTWK